MDYLLAEAAVLGGIVAFTIWWGRRESTPCPEPPPDRPRQSSVRLVAYAYDWERDE